MDLGACLPISSGLEQDIKEHMIMWNNFKLSNGFETAHY